MLRFVDLGKQLGLDEDWPRQFAFYTTITSQFVKLSGEQVFETWDEFELYYQMELCEEGLVAWEIERFRSLCPSWVFESV